MRRGISPHLHLRVGRRGFALATALGAVVMAMPAQPAGAAFPNNGSGLETHVYAFPPSGAGGNDPLPPAAPTGTHSACIGYAKSIIDVTLLSGTVGTATATQTSPIVLQLTVDTVIHPRWEGPGGTFDTFTPNVGCPKSNVGAIIPADTTSTVNVSEQGSNEVCGSPRSVGVTSIQRSVVAGGQQRVVKFTCNNTAYTLTATGIPNSAPPPATIDPPCTPAALSISCPESDVVVT